MSNSGYNAWERNEIVKESINGEYNEEYNEYNRGEYNKDKRKRIIISVN